MRQQSVQHKHLILDSDLSQLFGCAGCFREGGFVRAGYKDKCRQILITEHFYRLLIHLAMLVQTRQLSETRCAVGARIDKRIPGAGQLEHPQRMTGRRRVEDNRVVIIFNIRICDEF